ncbi:MAG: very short patch repair endonuclease [Betaproteobacteria bacterium]|nr:very short patch repair endonuclease [Betaproteobacteria bacterium]
MTDRLTPEQRSLLMQKVRGANTRPEKVVRSLLHRLGFRFRLHRKDLPGTPDIVLPRWHVALFVHGCFWHGHGCSIGRLPKSNTEYWRHKIEGNIARDQRKQAQLESLGWHVVVVWQCELRDHVRLSRRLSALRGKEGAEGSP